MTDFAEVACPTCFEVFALPAPDASEVPCELDYDCEVCCAPMRVLFTMGSEGVEGDARGLAD